MPSTILTRQLRQINAHSRDVKSTVEATDVWREDPNQIGIHSRTKNRGNTRKKIKRKKIKIPYEYERAADKKTNFAKKIDVPGRPIVVKTTIKERYHSRGARYHSPAICQ